MKHETLEIVTKNALETQKLGRILGEEIIWQPAKNKKALVIGLEGELGSGKTTFVQGLAKGLGIKRRITSPTFVILKRYGVPALAGQNLSKDRTPTFFYHIDCYRINKPKELIDLDFREILNNPKNIIVIEWAERVKKILPKNTLWIKFEHASQDKRRISIG